MSLYHVDDLSDLDLGDLRAQGTVVTEQLVDRRRDGEVLDSLCRSVKRSASDGVEKAGKNLAHHPQEEVKGFEQDGLILCIVFAKLLTHTNTSQAHQNKTNEPAAATGGEGTKPRQGTGRLPGRGIFQS